MISILRDAFVVYSLSLSLSLSLSNGHLILTINMLVRVVPGTSTSKSGSEVIKLFSCSTQLSMNFQMLISIKI